MKLTEWTTCGGCAAKWGGAPLTALLASWSAPRTPTSLILGLAPFDDAAVYRLGPDTALVSTTDFFPPLVDDPADFGAIAAANACSDVFAMGGRVVLALNVAAFPERMPDRGHRHHLGAAAEVVPRRAARGRRPHHPFRASRSSAWPSRAWCTPTGCGARPAPGRATALCSRSRSGQGSSSPAAPRRTRRPPSR